MTIWGKIIGGAAGFILAGGPLGALMGSLAGHYVIDKQADKSHGAHRDARDQVAFTIGVIALGAKMAKADGHVTRDEVNAFREVFQVPPQDFETVKRVFNRARQDMAGYEGYARQISDLFRGNPGVLEDLLDGLFHIAKADGVIHPKEIEYLKDVARIFGFSDNEFARIRSRHLGAEASDPYVILGVEATISDKDLKVVYRRLVRENHPDALIARGVPEEFIVLANEKLAVINDAYDRVSRSRGLT